MLFALVDALGAETRVSTMRQFRLCEDTVEREHGQTELFRRLDFPERFFDLWAECKEKAE
jgi:hypothetical protein